MDGDPGLGRWLAAGSARQVVPEQGELLVDLRATSSAAAERLAESVRALVAAGTGAPRRSRHGEGGVTRPAWPRGAGRSSCTRCGRRLPPSSNAGARADRACGSDASLVGASVARDGSTVSGRSATTRAARRAGRDREHPVWGAIMASVARRPQAGHAVSAVVAVWLVGGDRRPARRRRWGARRCRGLDVLVVQELVVAERRRLMRLSEARSCRHARRGRRAVCVEFADGAAAGVTGSGQSACTARASGRRRHSARHGRVDEITAVSHDREAVARHSRAARRSRGLIGAPPSAAAARRH